MFFAIVLLFMELMEIIRTLSLTEKVIFSKKNQQKLAVKSRLVIFLNFDHTVRFVRKQNIQIMLGYRAIQEY